MTQSLENQSLLCPLGDQEDKNIYGWLSSLWGQAHTEQGCVSLPWDCSVRIAGPRQTQVVYSLNEAPETRGGRQLPLFHRDMSLWKGAQRNKGGFLSSVSLVLGGAEGNFFFPERWGECVLVNNMFPIICLLKVQGNLRMWLKPLEQRTFWKSPAFVSPLGQAVRRTQ